MDFWKVSSTKEEEVGAALKHPHVPEWCDKPTPNKHSLAVHQGRWCSGDCKTELQCSGKGQIADNMAQAAKRDTAASEQTILLGTLPLENVASFVYVDGLLMSSGDTEEEMEWRIGIAQGAFNQLGSNTPPTTQSPKV